jgi:hypothetical protein
MRTSSLDIQEEKNKEDHDSRIIKHQMEDANKAIKTLTMELFELQKLVKLSFFLFQESNNLMSFFRSQILEYKNTE